jgi:hypothetical protein
MGVVLGAEAIVFFAQNLAVENEVSSQTRWPSGSKNALPFGGGLGAEV